MVHVQKDVVMDVIKCVECLNVLEIILAVKQTIVKTHRMDVQL
jgi:hypothetical protein